MTKTLQQLVDDAQYISSRLLDTLNEIKEWYEGAKEDGNASVESLAVALYQIAQVHEAIDGNKSVAYNVKSSLEKHLLPERLEAQGLDMIRVPSIARSFSIRNNLSATMVDKDLAFAWLRELGQGDIITETVNAGTLGAFCRNLLLEVGTEPPPEAVKLTPYKSISVVKYTPK
jgi:hypothetical protein